MNEQTDYKPEKGKTYRLTYLGGSYGFASPQTIHSYEFEYMGNRGRSYYFYSHSRGIDLLLSRAKFNEYLNNTIEKLQNE